MKLAFTLLIVLLITNPTAIDFGIDKSGSQWRIVNDGVMGGRSTSSAVLTDETLYFTGNVSLENNGGFASIRSPYEAYDLSQYTEIVIKHRGTSRKFALSFDADRRWYAPNYKMEFYPSKDWQETVYKISDLKESRIGEYTGRKIPSEKRSEIIQMGIILYDKQAGPFELEVDYIQFR